MKSTRFAVIVVAADLHSHSPIEIYGFCQLRIRFLCVRDAPSILKAETLEICALKLCEYCVC